MVIVIMGQISGPGINLRNGAKETEAGTKEEDGVKEEDGTKEETEAGIKPMLISPRPLPQVPCQTPYPQSKTHNTI